MGMAFASTLAPDESFTTINLTINFFRPVWKGRLRTNRGKNVGYLECEILGEARKQIAKANSICCVLRAENRRDNGRRVTIK
jgi:acyl-coenzyme A thioesterase PaaI-like protein